MCGVAAGDIHRRIRLGKSFFLRLFQGLFIGPTVARHPGEDDVASAVDDADERVDSIRNQPPHEGIDNRHTTPGAGFESDAGIVLFGERKQLGTVSGEEAFVGSYDRLPQSQRRLYSDLGSASSADEFDHDIRVFCFNGSLQIRGNFKLATSRFRRITNHYMADFKAQSRTPAKHLALLGEDAPHAAPDDAATQKRDTDGTFRCHWRGM